MASEIAPTSETIANAPQTAGSTDARPREGANPNALAKPARRREPMETFGDGGVEEILGLPSVPHPALRDPQRLSDSKGAFERVLR